MKADGRCDACGIYISSGYEVKRRGGIFHIACAPSRRRVPDKKTGHEGTRPKETGGPFRREDLDEEPSLD